MARRRAGQARPVHPRARGLGRRTRRSAGTATGPGSAPIPRAGSRSPSARGSIVWRRARPSLLAVGTCAMLRRAFPAMREQPDRGDGPARLPRARTGRRATGSPIVNLPGCPTQPDNITETLLLPGPSAGGMAPPIELDDREGPSGSSIARSRRAATGRLRRAGRVRRRARPRSALHGEARVHGARDQVQRPGARMDRRRRRLPQRRGLCIGCTMPGFPDHFMPFGTRRPRRSSPPAQPASPTARSSSVSGSARSAANTTGVIPIARPTCAACIAIHSCAGLRHDEARRTADRCASRSRAESSSSSTRRTGSAGRRRRGPANRQRRPARRARTAASAPATGC